MTNMEEVAMQLCDQVEIAYRVYEGKNFEREELLKALLLAKEIKGFLKGSNSGRIIRNSI